MSDDNRRHFEIRDLDSIAYLMQKDLVLRCRSDEQVKMRRWKSLGNYILRDGDHSFSVKIASNDCAVFADNIKPVYRAIREAEKQLNALYEIREIAKPILPEAIFKTLEESVFDFYKAIDTLGTTKGFGNVGLILAGPAGVGKSETMRWLRQTICAVYGRSSFQLSMADLCGMLSEAKPLNTNSSLVLIDDIDVNILRDRRETNNPMTSQFLTCLDGLDKREGRVIVVSTNEKIDHIDPALLRPGRFEHVIYFTYPDHSLIAQFCNHRGIELDPTMFEDWSFARMDMFYHKWRIANLLHGMSQGAYHLKFITEMGEIDKTVEAYS